ncbi:MAG: MFS transporter [Hyphomicrobiaceae bacterium]
MSEATGTMNGDAGAPGEQAGRVGRLGIFGWVLYEWAAQPFYALIVTFLFAPYFANVFMNDPVAGQSVWGVATAIAAILIAVLSPIIGAVADQSGRRKPWILLSTVFFVIGMASLWYALPGRPELTYLVLAGYVLAWVAAEVNAVFINAIMPKLVPQSKLGRLSGIGAAVGYAGGLVALIVMVGLIAPDPVTGKTILGLDPVIALDHASREGDRLVGPFAAAWLLIFALPFFLFTPDPKATARSAHPVRDGLAQIGHTFHEIRRYGNIVQFLIARMLYQDGLSGVFTFAGIYAVNFFGWQLFEKGLFGIILSVAAMIGAATGGFIEDRLGPKTVIMTSLVLAIIATLGVLSIDGEHVLFVVPVAAKTAGAGAFQSTAELVFIAFAIVVGVVAGPLYSSSRSLMARISPPDKLAQFFGMFAFSGKATSFIAPLLIAAMTLLTNNERLGVGVVLVLLGIGFVLMLRVKNKPTESGL